MAKSEDPAERRARLAMEAAQEDAKVLARLAELSSQARTTCAEMETLAGQLIHAEAPARLSVLIKGQLSTSLGGVLTSVDRSIAALTDQTAARLKGEG